MFLKYTKEIYTIAKAKNVDVGVAFAMLNADIKAGKAQEGNTDGLLPGFDYAKAQAELAALNEDQQEAAYAEIKGLLADPNVLKALHAAYPSREKMDAVVGDWIVAQAQKDEQKDKE